MQRIFQQNISVNGSLAADVDYRFVLPCDAQLLHVSASQSGTAKMRVQVGDSDDTDEYLTYQTLSGSSAVDEYDGDDFVDSSGNSHNCYYPHISAGTTIVVGVDYNYNGGGEASAGADLAIVLTFAEG